MKSRKPSRKRGFLRTLTALSVLLIFPFISYVFLQYGFNFRVNMVSDLGDYGQWHDTTLVDDCCPKKSSELLKAITWQESFDTPQFSDLSDELDSLFAGGEKIQFLHIENGETYVHLTEKEGLKSSYFTYPLNSWSTGFKQDSIFNLISENLDKGNASAILVEGGIIKRWYNLTLEEEKDRFLEHIVALIPKQEKRREVPYKQLQIDQK